jgi:multicomponent K+:H+ antiporter subunit D
MMTGLHGHLIIAPVVLPLVAGAAALLVGGERGRQAGALFNLASTVALIFIAIALLRAADASPSGIAGVYRLGDWPAPFAIVLVADRPAAVMLLLTAVIGLAGAVFSLAQWHRAAPHFHSLFQFLLMGLNGAYLTGDLFNLFVFFEILLAASYGLALHGSGPARVRAGLHYIVVNLVASLLFLIGVSLIYAVSGTLNMADLAGRIAMIAGSDRALLEAGFGILGLAFLIKAGMWPLCFWLPETYGAASPPAACVFAVLTKLGAYVVIRLWLLLLGPEAGPSAHYGAELLLVGGLATVAFGAIGSLAAQDMGRLAAFSVLVSSGTVLAALSLDQAAVTGAALFYLSSSTLGLSAFFLLIELIERGREPGADVLAVTREAFGDDEQDATSDQEEVGFAIPATMGVLGLSFLGCALVISGLPPLSGFIGKFALLSAAITSAPAGDAGIPLGAWALLAMLILSGLAAMIAMTRAGMRALWGSPDRTIPRVRVIEIAPVVVLLVLCAVQTVYAGPMMRFMQAAALSLHAPRDYVAGVMRPPPVRPAPGGGT